MFKKLLSSVALIALAASLVACTNNSSSSTSSSSSGSSVQAKLSDTALESNINESIENAYPSNRFPHRVTAVVWEGKTLLIGQALSQELADNIYKVVTQVYGVDQILNQIEVNTRFNPTISSNITDSAITAQVKSRLALTKGIPSTKIKVITQNGVVFLLSKATSEQTETAARVAAIVSGVSAVKIVTLN
ncbi:BON domain-containing protein [Psittacicella hinzii]|uniref:BON domain-containing protein n=1 Tax=Psittacicella hinzii TaxID=2028575 RepID=A0A3A1Y9K6_9GAMM|nr:BON domain-containing protein [Psittacicella hinzii]RIY34993.1 hypothetical protein CKF58_07270 [Psittacicella hinzii]